MQLFILFFQLVYELGIYFKIRLRAATCGPRLGPIPEKFSFLFCYNGQRWDNLNLNKFCTLDNNIKNVTFADVDNYTMVVLENVFVLRHTH